MQVYPYAAQFVLLYHLRPLLPNSSHYLCIWNNAFHSDMACRRVVAVKKDKKFDLMEKDRKKNLFVEKGCFQPEIAREIRKKWSRGSTAKILGLN